jgi:methylated-DNA-[protein]-cysteine S-methyltransferase
MWSEKGLKALKIGVESLDECSTGNKIPDFVRQASMAVSRHLLADLQDFSSFPVDIDDLPIFTRLVLTAVRQIPPGSCMTYKEVAEKIGFPGAQRAVGIALKRNPLPIVIPCHRVVGRHGIGGYSGFQGVEFKRWLLTIEGVLFANPRSVVWYRAGRQKADAQSFISEGTREMSR